MSFENYYWKIRVVQQLPLMAEIHNTKKRMPILLTKQNQYTWLDDIPVEYFLYPEYDPPLESENLTNIEGTATLF